MSIKMLAVSAVGAFFVAAGPATAVQTSVPTPAFATEAARGGHAEVALGKLGQAVSTNAGLRAAAKKIEMDHVNAGVELKKLAANKHWSLPPDTDLGTDGQTTLNHLRTLKGAAFDNAWIDHMIEDHEKDVATFKTATQNEDQELRAFAERTLPVIQSHLEMVRKLKELL
jgi:putative membrane protein